MKPLLDTRSRHEAAITERLKKAQPKKPEEARNTIVPEIGTLILQLLIDDPKSDAVFAERLAEIDERLKKTTPYVKNQRFVAEKEFGLHYVYKDYK